eukprot:1141211-Pelagomonas_calceolata.AAC.2
MNRESKASPGDIEGAKRKNQGCCLKVWNRAVFPVGESQGKRESNSEGCAAKPVASAVRDGILV